MNYSGLDNISNYTGYTYDEVLEIYYAQARFYDPETRRFIQEDPVKDGGNWYAYCGDNPVTRVDPLGLVLQIVGTETEKSRLLRNLNYLTDYTLEMKDDGTVYIAKEGEGKYVKSNELVKSLIDNSYMAKMQACTGVTKTIHSAREGNAMASVRKDHNVVININLKALVPVYTAASEDEEKAG